MNVKKVIVTGADGFIGSNLVRRLLREGIDNFLLVDDFSIGKKDMNLAGINAEKMEREEFPNWLNKNHSNIEFIFHLGARTDTTEFDFSVGDKR